MKTLRASLLLAAVLSTSALRAQTAAPAPLPPYTPLQTSAPLTLPDAVNAYRSSNGAPGPHYWQNRAHTTLSIGSSN